MNSQSHGAGVDVAGYFRRQYGLIRQCVVCVDPLGKIGYVNPHALRVLGVDETEIVGRVFTGTFLERSEHTTTCFFQWKDADVPLTYEVDPENPAQTWPEIALQMVPDTAFQGWRIMFAGRMSQDARDQISAHFTDLRYVLSAILSNAPVQLFIKDAEDGFKYVIANRNFIDYYRLCSTSVLDRDDFSIFEPEVAAQLRKNDLQVCEKPGKIFHLLEDVSYQRSRREIFKSIKVCFEDNRHHRYLLGVCTDITEQKHNELQLQHTGTMLQTLMDSIPASIYVQDAETRKFLFANKRTGDIVSMSPENIIGKTFADVAGDKNAREFSTVLDRALNENSLASATFTYDLNSFHQRSEKLFAIPVDNVVSGKKELLAASFEITHEVELEKEIRRRGKYRDFINEMLEMSIHIIFEEPTKSDAGRNFACEYVLRRFAELFDAAQTIVMKYDMKTHQASPYSFYSQYSISDIPSSEFDANSSLWGELLTRKVLVFEELDTIPGRARLPRWASAFEQLETKSLYTCGIFHDKELIGTLSILFKKGYRKIEFGTLELDLLQSVGHIIDILLVYRKAQLKLLKSESEKQLIMDTISIPTLLFDAVGNVINVNAAAQKLFGAGPYPKEEPVRQTFLDRHMHRSEILLDGHEYMVRGNPIGVDGRLLNVLATYVDVSELKDVQRRLTEAMHVAEAANKAKSFFLANMSHELRTPLNAVLGYCELLQGGGLSQEEIQDYLESIRFSGNALLRLINNILDLSKVEAGQMVFLPKSTDLKRLAREMAAIFKQICIKNSIELSLDIPAELPFFMIDEARLRQILLNLIGNACKFTHDGFIRITILHIPESEEKGTVKISIEDSGCGIAPDMQQEIFKPFVQQNTMADSHVYKGTGLGLSISKEMVEHMGGQLELESELGKGSIFTIILPGTFYAKTAPTPSVAIPESLLSRERRVSLDVMLVDDVAMNLKVLSAICKKLGVRCRMETSGRTALEQMRIQPPNLVLTDMWMPGMNGPALLAEIRKDERLKNIPVVIVTADVESKEHGLLKEFDDIVLKPISQDRLREVFNTQYRK